MELLSLPTSPFNEQRILAYIRQWAIRRSSIQWTSDAFGNLWLRLLRGRTRKTVPMVFSAHTDHPGFEAVRMVKPRRLRAVFRGGVSSEYFVGSRVRFWCHDRWVRGTITSKKYRQSVDGKRHVESVLVCMARDVPAGVIGMWDLPDPIVRNGRVYARGCDDIAGVAAILAALDKLHRQRGPIDLYAIFTRAEEVGFAGAITGCKSGLFPKQARIVGVECSSEIPGVRMGAGPILRVGDRTTTFTPAFTDFCGQVARDLSQKERRFTFQRKLMDRGVCESSVFCEYGFEATGLCLALGNYHNMNTRKKRIAAEYIELDDYDKLVKWLVALATPSQPRRATASPLRKTLDRLGRQWTPTLRRTAKSIEQNPSTVTWPQVRPHKKISSCD